ncbi:MAG: hypothetical protein AAGI68_00805 [Planctomycetota bacterium]
MLDDDHIDDETREARAAYRRSRFVRTMVLNGIAVLLLAIAAVLAFGEFSWQLSVLLAVPAFALVVIANQGGEE